MTEIKIMVSRHSAFYSPVIALLASGQARTSDMGGTHKTHEIGDVIKEAILR
jgi:isocitrate/isopropylmalate dehydrogenase